MSQQAMTEQLDRIISANIRKYRLQRGLKQEEVAGGLCSVSQFSKLENGKSPIKLELLKAIAARLGVSVGQLQSVDDRRQEWRDLLEMSRNCLMAQKVELSLQYARSVAEQCQEHGDRELYEMAILQELQALTQVFRYVEAIELLERVMFGGPPISTPLNQTLFDLELGRAHAMTGNREKSYTFFYRGEEGYLRLEDSNPDSIELVRITYLLARGFLYMRKYQTGLRYAREARRLALLHGMTVHEVDAKSCEGGILILMGALDEAIELYLPTLEEAQNLRLLFWVAIAQNNIGCIFFKKGEFGEAKIYFQRSLKNIDLIENGWEVMSDSLLHMAEIAMLEDDEAGMLHYAQRMKTLLDAKRPHGYMYRAALHVVLSRLHIAHERTEEGIAELKQALEIYDEHSAYLEAYEVAIQLADLLYQQQDAMALPYYRKAIDYDRQAQVFSMK